MIQIVWFKRDLRIHDHRPLAAAAVAGPVLALYVLEAELWRQPDRSGRQWHALHRQLVDLDAQLAQRLSLRLAVFEAEMIDALVALRAQFGHFRLLAHEETGSAWTFRRDRRVIDWCREMGIEFHETPQFGVIRRLQRRDGWAGRWDRMMGEPLTPPPACAQAAPWPRAARVPSDISFDLADPPLVAPQAVGRQAAVDDLETFLRTRAQGYRAAMSSPLSAASNCSRLSVHLSVGSIAMREVWQATRRRREQLRGRSPERVGSWPRDLAAFEGRLHWHCHFMQKLESEPAIEFRNLSRAVDGLREDRFDEGFFDAWCRGETGYPYVDACMRYLRATGWLNFRARAMLMSFAAYDLWLHWPQPAHHLARLFIDYEPGIHYSQVQMQSGTTGINTLRIYNPVKQGQDHDPGGEFVARWVPELAALPARFRHEPWRLSPAEARAAGLRLGVDYPQRIVDHAAAARAAQAAVRARRRSAQAREEAAAIHATHGSRRRS